ncbi:MAG: Rpn family recombination-promoting nuclease/putative transposase [Myxococcota bacterium]
MRKRLITHNSCVRVVVMTQEEAEEHFPHDRFFKFLTKHRAFYLPFLLFYLPFWVRRQIVLERAQPASENFLRKSGLIAADAVFRAPLRDGAGEGCIVVELQAARDSRMDLRAFGYKAGGFEQLMTDGKKGRSRPGLVYVLVVYIGDEGWRPRLDPFRRLPPNAREAARRAWREPAGFVDARAAESRPPPEEAVLAAGMFLLAHGRDPDPREVLRRLDPLLARVAGLPDGRELIHRMVLYAGQIATGQDRVDRVKLFTEGIAKHLHGAAREEAMSIWQAIGKEHELMGLREGLEKGKLEGKLEKAVEIARNMLRKGMPVAAVAEVTRLTRYRVNKLKSLSR